MSNLPWWSWNGYGFFVWGSILCTVMALLVDLWLLRRDKTQALQAVSDSLADSPDDTLKRGS